MNTSMMHAWYCDRTSLLDNPSPKYDVPQTLRAILEAQKPFDLATISRDITTDWDGRVSSGLNSAEVRSRVAGKRVLGATLRAVPSKPKAFRATPSVEGRLPSDLLRFAVCFISSTYAFFLAQTSNRVAHAFSISTRSHGSSGRRICGRSER